MIHGPVFISNPPHLIHHDARVRHNPSGLVTDYDSGLKWVKDGGLAFAERSNAPVGIDTDIDPDGITSGHDVKPRGRPSRSSASTSGVSPTELSITTSADERAAQPMPIKAYEPKASLLPEEGERIPNPIHPETPPHSRSNSLAPSDKSVTNNDFASRPLNHLPGHAEATEPLTPPLHLLFLGSSLGNFDRVEAATFLRTLPLRAGTNDTLLLGLDGRNNKVRVERAYNDPEGYTAKFILNGLDVAGRVLGVNFSTEDRALSERFDYYGVYNEGVGETKSPFTVGREDAFTEGRSLA